MIKICIDPGHGGNSRSNVGPNGYVEADGVLKISLFLKEELESTGAFSVYLTRDRDSTLGLTERALVAVRNKCEIFISEHTNAGPYNSGGTTVFYSVDLPGDKALAERFSKAISGALGISDRGAKTRSSDRNPGEDYYTVIDVAQDSGVKHVFLIESAFHSNPDEEKLLLQDVYLRKIAKAQAEIICSFYDVPYPNTGGGTNPQPQPQPQPVPQPSPKPAGNENVKMLQRLANELGVGDMNGRRLIVDGIAGPKTRYAVQRLPILGRYYTQRRSAIIYVQRKLNKLRFRDNSGKVLAVDGKFGRKTESSVKKFQRANGLSVDGIVGPNTWSKFL